MSMIEVDMDVLNTAQQSVYDYIQLQKNKTNDSKIKVEEMGASWKGTDYTRLQNKWTELTNSSSVASKTQTELESFNTYLTRCYNEYDKMQVDLQSIAMNIPKN